MLASVCRCVSIAWICSFTNCLAALTDMHTCTSSSCAPTVAGMEPIPNEAEVSLLQGWSHAAPRSATRLYEEPGSTVGEIPLIQKELDDCRPDVSALSKEGTLPDILGISCPRVKRALEKGTSAIKSNPKPFDELKDKYVSVTLAKIRAYSRTLGTEAASVFKSNDAEAAAKETWDKLDVSTKTGIFDSLATSVYNMESEIQSARAGELPEGKRDVGKLAESIRQMFKHTNDLDIDYALEDTDDLHKPGICVAISVNIELPWYVKTLLPGGRASYSGIGTRLWMCVLYGSAEATKVRFMASLSWFQSVMSEKEQVAAHLVLLKSFSEFKQGSAIELSLIATEVGSIGISMYFGEYFDYNGVWPGWWAKDMTKLPEYRERAMSPSFTGVGMALQYNMYGSYLMGVSIANFNVYGLNKWKHVDAHHPCDEWPQSLFLNKPLKCCWSTKKICKKTEAEQRRKFQEAVTKTQ